MLGIVGIGSIIVSLIVIMKGVNINIDATGESNSVTALVMIGRRKYNYKLLSIYFSNLTLMSIADCMYKNYDPVFHELQVKSAWLSSVIYIDSLSLMFILLTNFLCILCVLYLCYSFALILDLVLYLKLLFLLQVLLVGLFSVQNLLLFYVFFESTLIPLFLFIILWGSRGRKIHAAVQFFLYTFFSSVLIIWGLVEVYFEVGSLSVTELENSVVSTKGQILLFVCIFIGFMSKIPSLPLHIWLPEAHVEAPTVGSVLLAGILLKISGYGIIRIIYSACTFVSVMEVRMLAILVLSLSTLYSVFCAIVQIDLKKIIAYSSIVHMNFSFLGLFVGSNVGYVGCIFLMFSHGLISAGLFFCVGMLYDRFKTRNVLYYGGLVQYMPVFSTIFFMLVISNFSFPGTCNFVGELMVFIGIFEESLMLFVVCSVSMILVLVFCLTIMIRTLFYQISGFLRGNLIDLNEVETYIGISLVSYIIIFGLNPGLLVNLFTTFRLK